MRASFNWLKEFTDINCSPSELSGILTMAGLEVENVEIVGENLDKIIAAKVSNIRSHPSADKLLLCDANTGDGRHLQIVCGAPNIEDGGIYPLALPGTVLPSGQKIAKTKIRGEESNGMLLAEDELGLTDDHSGLMELPHDVEPGTLFTEIMPFPDYIFDFNITPNRPDWTSILGIAREIAALTDSKIHTPDVSYNSDGPPAEDLASVIIEDKAGCRRYVAGIAQGVKLGKSPFNMRYRLYSSGIRVINNLVDITNYILLELGQPLHSFDYDLLKQHCIVVKRAESGACFKTLDGIERVLTNEILMICDGKGPVAIAGIMGGFDSEIKEQTKNVLIESAYFDPVTIRRGSKYLGLSSESSYRFERGIDLENVLFAQKRALKLISEIGGGSIAKNLLDVYPEPYIKKEIDIRVHKANAVLGTSITADKAENYLSALGMSVRKKSDDILQVTPPSFRVDIDREIDLIEEIARMDGYDNIPVTNPKISFAAADPDILIKLKSHVRNQFVNSGFSEIVSFSFISPLSADRLNMTDDSKLRSFVEISNPISTEQSVMRTSLLPGLLDCARMNISNGEKSLKLFECGEIFFRKDESLLPEEKYNFAALVTGEWETKTWYAKGRESDIYDIKGVVESQLYGLGVNREDLSFKLIDGLPYYDYGYTVICKGQEIAAFGSLSRVVTEAFSIKQTPVFICEMDAAKIADAAVWFAKFKPFTNFPVVYRDIAFILQSNIEVGFVENIIKKTGGSLIEYVSIFDIYEGENLGKDLKSVAFNICFRSSDRTLAGEEINDIQDKIISAVEIEAGGRLKEA